MDHGDAGRALGVLGGADLDAGEVVADHPVPGAGARFGAGVPEAGGVREFDDPAALHHGDAVGGVPDGG
ncbi:hypothetical protein ACFRI7_29670 [Streptomyces sp. NPDC056716]|uniref:hypothetical protein n=1 Tax=unclassified Streptomyces TaxID=2593676 RepID=UPI0036D15B1C